MEEGKFDFKSVSEEEDKLDYDNLVSCPHCQKSIAADATLCYFCGAEVNLSRKRPLSAVWIAIAVVFILGLIFLSAG